MIVNRLKEFLGDMITPNQASFVSGRQSSDNLINLPGDYAHYDLHINKAGMVNKMDLKKTYDRFEWRFIEETLVDASIPANMIEVIIFMGMLKPSTCKLIWNGEATKAIKPSRGLRQGDSLSPYLFVMCMERLSSWCIRRWRKEDGDH